jgi:hypothetical protein
MYLSVGGFGDLDLTKNLQARAGIQYVNRNDILDSTRWYAGVVVRW